MGLYYDLQFAKGRLVNHALRDSVQLDSTTWLKLTDGLPIYLGEIPMIEMDHGFGLAIQPGMMDLTTYDALFKELASMAPDLKAKLGDYRGEGVLYCSTTSTLDMTSKVVWYVVIKN